MTYPNAALEAACEAIEKHNLSISQQEALAFDLASEILWRRARRETGAALWDKMERSQRETVVAVLREKLIEGEEAAAAEAAYEEHQRALMATGGPDDTDYRMEMVAAGRGHLLR